MFEIINLSKKYGSEYALKNISLKMGKGINFIVGPSGSGKTTLLKIINKMENEYEGEVLYNKQNIKDLSSQETSYFYNNIFGFVWQDYNLIEEKTALENIMLPLYLKEIPNEKIVEKILKKLKISELAHQKVKILSGGQKQRVAIARELMKNPSVIIADEPTSALDKETSKVIIDILRELGKSKTVIVVTHDTSLITKQDNVLELDKGELLTESKDCIKEESEIIMDNSHSLSFKNAFTIAKSNIKNKKGKFFISMLAVIITSVLLLITVNGSISSSNQKEFNKLFNTYGDSILDISIHGSFMNAAGGDDDKPNGDVNQDISGLYEHYINDERVNFLAYIQAFDNIKITYNEKLYNVENSGNTPTINKLLAGNMPSNGKNEVIVPNSFIKDLGISMDEAIGKEIYFTGTINRWKNGIPLPQKVSIKAKIVGVMDTTVKYEYEGKIIKYTIDDAFFFSKDALKVMTEQAKNDINKMGFLIRTKTPKDMISIKDELNKNGIVPIGRFELIEDMVRLNNQTTEQSGSANIVIALLSLVVVIAIFFITGFMRRKEAAIYKISGYYKTHLLLIIFVETLFIVVGSIIMMSIACPLINNITKDFFGVSVLNGDTLFACLIIVLITTLIGYIATSISFASASISNVLKSGEK